MKIILAPDSFKGSLSAVQAADIMRKAVLEEMPGADVICVPMADGGEGTVDALVAAGGGNKIPIEVTGPLGPTVPTYYGVIGKTVVLEVANLFGLTLVPEAGRNPLHTTSAALGEALKSALDDGYTQFVIGLGGSSTNDGGMGMLIALGAVFTNKLGERLQGFGRDLFEVDGVDFSGFDPRLQHCEITVACDVRNPLLGEEGASHIYGPQKGASPDLCRQLDEAMSRYASQVEAVYGSLSNVPGAGAAGGLGFALLALGAQLVSGAQVIEQHTGLREKIKDADWVITGEGRSDGQTLFGKLPLYIAQLARENGAEAILLSGSLGEDREKLAAFFAGCFSIVEHPASLEECMNNAGPYLYRTTRSLVRLIGRASSR